MNPDPRLLACVLGCLLAVFLILLIRKQRAETSRQARNLREELDLHRSQHTTHIEFLAKEIEALSTSRISSEEIIHQGRLNHSRRAQTLQMLRSGVEPERVAVSLRMPRRDVQLLGKLSRLLSTYR